MSQPSVKKNYIYSLSYHILSMIIPFITAPYIARTLGADGVGIYSYTQAFMTYFTMIAALGTASYGVREIARCRNNKKEYSRKFWEIELLTIITTSVCILAWLILIAFSTKYRIYLMALIPSLLATMFDISWFYTGKEEVVYIVLGNALCKILGVVGIFSLVKNQNDVALYIFLCSLVTMFGNLSMWLFLPKMLVRVDPKTFEIKKHFREIFIYFVPTIATTVYTVLDKTLIGIITRDNSQNGYYEQATQIINMAKTFVFASVNTVMSARISYLFSENRYNEIRKRIEKSMNYILLLGYAVFWGIIAIARDFVPVFLGRGFEPVINLLYWMSPLVLIIGISNCLGAQYYTPAGLRRQSSKYIIIGAMVNLILNFLMIPFFEATGAVAGTIGAELIISALYLKNCNGYLKLKSIFLYSYKRFLAGAIMFISIKVISICGEPNLFLLATEIFAGTVIYLTCLWIFKDEMIETAILMIRRKGK